MKNILKLQLIAILLVTVMNASACSGGVSDAEAATIVNALVDASLPLNVIYFGEGLPYEKSALSEATEAAAATADTDVDAVIYHPVSSEAEYQTIDEIKAATELVFSPSYCKILYETTFTGVDAGSDEASGISYGAVYARYIENYGELTVNANYKNPLPARSYDFTSTKIISTSRQFIAAEIDTYIDGEFSVTVTVQAANTPSGWRLDSPTY